jgi:ubiquitin-like protein Nedd8
MFHDSANNIRRLSKRKFDSGDGSATSELGTHSSSDEMRAVNRRIKRMKLVRDDERLRIAIQTLTGKQLELEVVATDTVYELKQLIEEIEGVPPEQQRLIHRGRTLVDSNTVQQSNVIAGTTLHLVLALRGGGR